jgi:hypothetical protein
MQDLKTDGMSRMERTILFIVLATILLFIELARQETVKQEQTADFKRMEQTKGGEQ